MQVITIAKSAEKPAENAAKPAEGEPKPKAKPTPLAKDAPEKKP
jgi:hypothetical protein